MPVVNRKKRRIITNAVKEYKARWTRSEAGVKSNLVRRARIRAAAANLPFDITVADVILPDTCPVLGVKLVVSCTQGGTDNSPSLDRIVPILGYVKGNIAVMSNKANRLKGTGNLMELLAVCQWLAVTEGIKNAQGL